MKVEAPIRILLAEDDPSVRGALSALIRSEEGFELTGAVASAEEAIELASREQPHVAVLDVRMPGGGPSAARGIKRRSPGTYVLALSASEDKSTVLEMLEAGAVGYLVKGTALEEIIGSIRRAANGQGSLSGEVTGSVIDELVEQREADRRAESQAALRRARIERAVEGEDLLQMVFQPIYDLRDRAAAGAEALARFKPPPERGPDRWFAEASETGLRTELEIAAVSRAFEELERIPDGAYLTVNTSPETLAAASFRDLVGELDGDRIVVELTEHAPIDDYDELNRSLKPLRSLGIRLAVDDVGAGFASLRHILRLSPDFIKLDRTLIDGIDQDRSRQALAAGLISFADGIDAPIIAEGIERPAEVATLVDLGVPYGQGYLFARPAPLPFPIVAAPEPGA